MSRNVWLMAAALVVATVALLFWIDRDEEPSEPPIPHARPDGGARMPHPDRAGLPRRHQTK
jgi:hypothetical protein